MVFLYSPFLLVVLYLYRLRCNIGFCLIEVCARSARRDFTDEEDINNMRILKRLRKSAYAKLLLVIPVVLILSIVFVTLIRKDKKDESDNIRRGIAYLESLEARNPQDMLEELRQKHREKQAAKVDEILARIDSGELSVWSQFKNSAILGDSRAEDFVADGFLTATNVYAEKGTMCSDAMNYIDAVAATNPTWIFFTYGMNDVDGYWNNSKEFIDAYTNVIKSYHEKIPGAVIFVNSIIPVNDHALEKDSNYKNIPEYNTALKKMAEDLGVCWIDCDDYLTNYPELYDTDGQHFFAEMYPIWAKTMLKAAFDYEYSRNEDADMVVEESAADQANADSGSQDAGAGADGSTDGAGDTADQSDTTGSADEEANDTDESSAGTEG